ncbi:MAG: hypothetical protein M1828_000375 [Chrysothrix sp. TS-e1954]|nr:MAG: hypothetical protein M1828_000375 [Chrysothrix sp. TS-e1954]
MDEGWPLGRQTTEDTTILETFDCLADRLSQIETSVKGEGNTDFSIRGAGEAATDRLRSMEIRLSQLAASRSTPAKQLLALHARIPEIQAPDGWRTESTKHQTHEGKVPEILSSSSLVSAAASDLAVVQDLRPRDLQATTAFNVLRPGVEAAQRVSSMQSLGTDALRQLSATMLVRWYQCAILEEGEEWSRLETRLGRIEQRLRQREQDDWK